MIYWYDCLIWIFKHLFSLFYNLIILFCGFFIHSWRIILEILIISTTLYYIYLYLRKTHTAHILVGFFVIFIILIFISQILNLVVLGWTLRSLSVFLSISSVILFQAELRRALHRLGKYFLSPSLRTQDEFNEMIDTIFDLSNKNFGALIAIEREVGLDSYAQTGLILDAIFSKDLLLTIFHPKTILHDGGVIIHRDRIVSAGSVFPLTQREDLDRTLGLRHRAGLGLSEESDALVVVISEESGQIALCHAGIIERNLSLDIFSKRLFEILVQDQK